MPPETWDRADSIYQHSQSAPMCWLLYAVGISELGIAVSLWNQPALPWILGTAGAFVCTLAAGFHHLTVTDCGERLRIQFGPLPLFGRWLKYRDVVDAEPGRTTVLDGWGIHMSLRGGWVWNLWGRDCVVVRLHHGVLRIGTDDAEALADVIQRRAREFASSGE